MVTARVERWIKIVLDCNDPATYEDAPEAAKTVGEDKTEDKTEAPAAKPAQAISVSSGPLTSPVEDSTDDLPF